MATVIAIAHDVGSYCTAQGSPLFYCSLDAEGAFAVLPHCVILQKSMEVVSDKIWLLLYYWYSNMTVRIRHRNSLSEQIKVERGTRQGGLTSPLLFNMYYKDLIQELQECSHGVTINSHHYNSFCYADDVLLCSTTVSGLQELINIATR